MTGPLVPVTAYRYIGTCGDVRPDLALRELPLSGLDNAQGSVDSLDQGEEVVVSTELDLAFEAFADGSAQAGVERLVSANVPMLVACSSL